MGRKKRMEASSWEGPTERLLMGEWITDVWQSLMSGCILSCNWLFWNAVSKRQWRKSCIRQKPTPGCELQTVKSRWRVSLKSISLLKDGTLYYIVEENKTTVFSAAVRHRVQITERHVNCANDWKHNIIIRFPVYWCEVDVCQDQTMRAHDGKVQKQITRRRRHRLVCVTLLILTVYCTWVCGTKNVALHNNSLTPVKIKYENSLFTIFAK